MQFLRILVLATGVFFSLTSEASLDDIIDRILHFSSRPDWHCSDATQEMGLTARTKEALQIRVEGNRELYLFDQLVFAGDIPITSVQVYTPPYPGEIQDESDTIGLILLINRRHIRAFTDRGKIGRGTYDRQTQKLSMNFGAVEETDWQKIKRQIAAFEARPLHVRQKMGYQGG